VHALIIAAISFGLIGLFDDLTKISLKNYAGITAKIKFFLQLFFAVIIYFIVENNFEGDIATKVVIPFFKSLTINLGFFYILFILFLIVGSSNAVNLTDGLDGLASFPVFICTFSFIIVAFFVSDTNLAEKVNMFHVMESAEIIPVCSAVCAACLGFLWFNAKPASIMMGDVGSLSLGALVATMAFILKQEILLAFFGMVFVIETMSVIIQVLYFKKTGGKRLFLMSPIHHHFEKKGWEEGKIVVRFWMLSILGAVLGMYLFFS
jgi:phospho-N-acetylmuramoyl-pentapeptide-transferase